MFILLLSLHLLLSAHLLHAQDASAPPAAWERLVHGLYTHQGVAKIDLVAGRYVLTVYCHGVHSVYIHSAGQIDLTPYLTHVVQVRYLYSVQERRQVRCIKAPCPPVLERGIIVHVIQSLGVALDELTAYTSHCGQGS